MQNVNHLYRPPPAWCYDPNLRTYSLKMSEALDLGPHYAMVAGPPGDAHTCRRIPPTDDSSGLYSARESRVTSPDLLATFPSGTHSTIESFIRTLSGEASIGIFLADPEGHTLYLNDRLRLMAGLPSAATTGDCWLHALSPEDHDVISAEWASAIADHRSFSREFRFQRPDGSVRWVMAEAFPLRTHGEISTGYVGMVRDVTPRQLAMEALHTSEERYRNLILASPHAILVHADQAILFINQAGTRLFGLTSARDIEGRLLTECFPEDFIRGLLPGENLGIPTPPAARRTTI